jgi:hypothetical protein
MGALLKYIVLFGIIIFIIRAFLKSVLSIFIPPKQTFQKQRTQQRREGEVRLENNTPKQSHISRDEGEYVDFEEIE